METPTINHFVTQHCFPIPRPLPPFLQRLPLVVPHHICETHNGTLVDGSERRINVAPEHAELHQVLGADAEVAEELSSVVWKEGEFMVVRR